jgi:predicted RNA binding protein YcfA (HicA-like mRNA interferase family)
MKYRDIAKALRRAGFTVQPGKGDHEKWTGPKGGHVTVRRNEEASPGVVRQVLDALEREE